MKKSAIVLICMVLALPLAAAAASLGDEAVKHFTTSKEFTLAVAEAMPADSYDFKPNPEEMGFGELMIHTAMSQAMMVGRVADLKSPLGKPDPKDKAAVMKLIADSFDFCLQALKGLKDEQLEKMFGRAGGPQSSGRETIWSAFTHTAHHRGQAEVYLRVKNIKPPQYRF